MKCLFWEIILVRWNYLAITSSFLQLSRILFNREMMILAYCSVSWACPTKTLVERIVYVSTFRESIWNVNWVCWTRWNLHHFRNLFFQIESIIVLQTICKTSWKQRGLRQFVLPSDSSGWWKNLQLICKYCKSLIWFDLFSQVRYSTLCWIYKLQIKFLPSGKLLCPF